MSESTSVNLDISGEPSIAVLLNKKRLTEGLNVLEKSDGVTLSAEVKRGQVVGYVYTDAAGNIVPSFLTSQKGLDSIECFLCRTRDGVTTCRSVPCP